MKHIALVAALGLAACSASQNSAVDRAVVAGQAFCAKVTALGPLVIALVDTAGIPITVTGKTAATVAAACALANAIPVSPPANPAQAPVVAVKVP